MRMTAGSERIRIASNHDQVLPSGILAIVEEKAVFNGLHFRHEVTRGVASGEISGHFHPKARVRSRGRTLSCHSFATDGWLLILPDFGTYSGRLDVLDEGRSELY